MTNRLNVAISQVTPEADFIQRQMDIVDENIQRITELNNKYMDTTLTTEEAEVAKQFEIDRNRGLKNRMDV